jgi:hypothetical protein
MAIPGQNISEGDVWEHSQASVGLKSLREEPGCNA